VIADPLNELPQEPVMLTLFPGHVTKHNTVMLQHFDVLYFADFASVYSIANKRSQQIDVLIYGGALSGVVVINGHFCNLTRVKVAHTSWIGVSFWL